MDEVSAVGHRVVHAGEKYSGSVLIDEDVLDALRECVPLAPLHNPANITGIEAAQAGHARRAHGRRVRHRLPPDHARPRLHLPHPLPALRGVPDPALRLPRHQPPLRDPARRPDPRTRPGRPEPHHLPPGQRRLDGRGPGRPVHRHLHGPDPAGRPDDGHPQRRHRPGHRGLPGTHAWTWTWPTSKRC